ncbi:MAG: hypothetical protein SF162_00880 [bacterium]|nr:hypothetical protein [bacterium]
MEQHHQEIENAGLAIKAIAVGEPKHAARYCPDLIPHAECYPAGLFPGKLYGTFGMQTTLKMLLNPNTAAEGAKASAEYGGGMLVGDPTTQPATFIIDPAGIVRYAYYAPTIYEHPSIADILKAAATLKSDS